MRAILVVGMMALAGPALAQSGKNAAIKAVAEITAAAPFCGFDVERDAVEKYLAERGVSRAKAPDAEELERSFNMASSGWRVTSSVYGKGKPQFDAACQQSIDAFGPTGTIRAGLIKLR